MYLFFNFAHCIKALDNVLFIKGAWFPLIIFSFIGGCLLSEFKKNSLQLSDVISASSLIFKLVFNSDLKEFRLKFL